MQSRAYLRFFACLCIAFFGSGPLVAQPTKFNVPKALHLFPAKMVLNGPRDSQRIGVLGEFAGGQFKDLTREANFTTGAAAIARVSRSGVVEPASDGQTKITIEAS